MQNGSNESNFHEIPLAVVSLDQDRVNHEYLFHVLEKFGIPPTFLKAIRLIYNGNQCLIRIGKFFSAPLGFRRGIRQGDPLSGPFPLNHSFIC